MMHTIVTPLRLCLIFQTNICLQKKKLSTKSTQQQQQLTAHFLSLSVSLLIYCKSLSLQKLQNLSPQMASVLNTVPSLRLSNFNNTNRVRTRQVFAPTPVSFSFTSEFTPQYFLYFVPFDYPKKTPKQRKEAETADLIMKTLLKNFNPIY